MSCQHLEDVCQHCLEKVQTTTEDELPPKLVAPPEYSPPEKSMTTKEKAFFILLDSSLIVAAIAASYWASKNSLKAIFDSFDNIIGTIEAPTKKRKNTD